jgi:hypothetical protein
MDPEEQGGPLPDRPLAPCRIRAKLKDYAVKAELDPALVNGAERSPAVRRARKG